MEQTNVKKKKERLELCLSIRKGVAYGVAKQIATKFRENQIRYKFAKEKYSVKYFFKDFYIKVFYPKYENAKLEVHCFKNSDNIKEVLNLILVLVKDEVDYSKKNFIFLNSYLTFDVEDTVSVCELRKKVFSNYQFEEKGEIFCVDTKLSYRLKVEKDLKDKIECSDNLTIALNLKKGMLNFVTYFISKVFSESTISRNNFLGKIEKI